MCDVPNSPIANAIAVQVLRRIYGDNPSGWNVSPNDLAAIIDHGLDHERQQHREQLEIYQQAIEAVDLLSKPPLWPERPQEEQLRSMLSDRLQAIHELARRVTETTGGLHKPSHD